MLPAAAQAYASRVLNKDAVRARFPASGSSGMMPGMGGMPGMPGMSGMPGLGGIPGSGKREVEAKKKESKPDKPAAEKEDPDRARRIRQLQEEAERLRALLNKLKEDAKRNDE